MVAHAVFTALVVGVIVLAGLRVYVIVLRNDAEMLKGHVLALTPGKSTLGDVQRFVQQYGHRNDFVDRCDESECHVSTGICAFYFAGVTNCALDNRLLRVLGIRPAHYQAGIDVVNGVVKRVSFHASYRTAGGAWLSATSVVVDDFTPFDRCSNPGILRHPAYALDSGALNSDAGGRYLRAGVTRQASADEGRRARTLNLACVTALRGCEMSDLMPLAYSDWMTDSKWQRDRQAEPGIQAGFNVPGTPSSREVPWWATGWRVKPF